MNQNDVIASQAQPSTLPEDDEINLLDLRLLVLGNFATSLPS